MYDTPIYNVTGAGKTAVLLLICAILILSGCGTLTRTPYERPALDVPGQWKVKTCSNAIPRHRFWQVFNDPDLNGLINKALVTNNDLAAATIRVRRARLSAGLTATNQYPDFSLGANAGGNTALDSGTTSKSFGTSAGLSWELDLWGKLSRARDAAQWEALATEEDRANTALTLVGTTADLYWQIAYLNEAIRTSRESISYTRETLKIVRAKYDAGDVAELALLQSEQNVESQKADLSDLNQQMAEARNALAVLFNQAPGPVMADPRTLADMPLPVINPGIPAQVLGNRPDLKAAEMRLRKTLAQGDVTRLNYYPGISLTGDLGTASQSLLKVLENPVASLGAGLTLPFVQWQDREFNIKIAREDYKEAVVNFRGSLYAALADVENALSARTHYIVRQEALSKSLALARKAEDMARVRYEAGQTSVQDWLDQQETRRTAELSLARNHYNQLTNLMTLYLALGGDEGLAGAMPE